MDSKQFDLVTRHLSLAGTRRRALAALAAGGLSLGALRLSEVEAGKKRKKKNRKKKRCKNLGQPCNPGGKRKCCGDLLCQVREGNTAADCCLAIGSPCTAAEDCCEGACIPPLVGSGPRICQFVS
jgi:hypothetical protein